MSGYDSEEEKSNPMASVSLRGTRTSPLQMMTTSRAGPLSVAAASAISGSSSGSSTRSNGEMISFFLNRIRTVEQAIQCIYGPTISLEEARQIAQDILGELEDSRHRGTVASQRTSVIGNPAKAETIISNLRKIAKLRNYVYGVLSKIEDMTDAEQIQEIQVFAEKIEQLRKRGQVGAEINEILQRIESLQASGLSHDAVMGTLKACKEMLSKLTIGHQVQQDMTTPTEIQPLWSAMSQQIATSRTLAAIGGTANAIGSVAAAAATTAATTVAATTSLVGQGLYTCFSTSYQIASLSIVDRIRQIRDAPSPMAAAGVVALESYLATTTGLGNSLQLLEMLSNTTRIDVGSALDQIIADAQSLGTKSDSDSSSMALSMAAEAQANEAAIDELLAANAVVNNVEDDTTRIPIEDINQLIGDSMADEVQSDITAAAASSRSNLDSTINNSLLALRAIEGTAQDILRNMSRLASVDAVDDFNRDNIVLPLDKTGKRKADAVQESISEVMGEIDAALAGSPQPMSRSNSKVHRTNDADDVSEFKGGRRRKTRRSKRARKTRKMCRNRRRRTTKSCRRMRRSMKRR